MGISYPDFESVMNFGTGLGYPVSVQLDATICSQSPVTVVCFKNVKSDLGVSYPDIELLKAVLKAAEHVLYKLATVMYRSLNGTAPSYLAAGVTCLTCHPGDVCGHH